MNFQSGPDVVRHRMQATIDLCETWAPDLRTPRHHEAPVSGCRRRFYLRRWQREPGCQKCGVAASSRRCRYPPRSRPDRRDRTRHVRSAARCSCHGTMIPGPGERATRGIGLFTLLSSRFSVRVQVRFELRRSAFSVQRSTILMTFGLRRVAVPRSACESWKTRGSTWPPRHGGATGSAVCGRQLPVARVPPGNRR